MKVIVIKPSPCLCIGMRAQEWITGFKREVVAHLYHARWLFIGVALYAAAGTAYLLHRERFSLMTYQIYTDKLGLFILMLLPLIALIWLAVSSMARRPAALCAHIASRCTPAAVAHCVTGLLLIALFIPFLATFTQIKGTLSRYGFDADPMLADVETWLHGGVNPSNWLASYYDSDAVLRLVQINYNRGWQVYNLMFMALIVLHPALAALRRAYLAFYFTMWVLLGNILAATFISAGPAFYGIMTGDTARFAPLQVLLESGKALPHSAYSLQHYLLHYWQKGTSELGTGISAFPSVHVFVVACNALFIYHYLHRGIGLLAVLYALLVLLSSAYLGWHYLIDGYLSILLTIPAFYFFMRHIPKRHD